MLNSAHIHFERSQDNLVDAKRSVSRKDKSRFLDSSVESAVAIVEVLLSQTIDKEKMRKLAWDTLPRYRLLKRVRIHNFHRRPVPVFTSESNTKIKMRYMQGPITLNTGTNPNSSVIVTLGANGLQSHVFGSGKVDRKGGAGGEKEICIVDGKLVDEYAGDRISLERALEEYLDKIPMFFKAAVNLLEGRDNTSS